MLPRSQSTRSSVPHPPGPCVAGQDGVEGSSPQRRDWRTSRCSSYRFSMSVPVEGFCHGGFGFHYRNRRSDSRTTRSRATAIWPALVRHYLIFVVQARFSANLSPPQAGAKSRSIRFGPVSVAARSVRREDSPSTEDAEDGAAEEIRCHRTVVCSGQHGPPVEDWNTNPRRLRRRRPEARAPVLHRPHVLAGHGHRAVVWRVQPARDMPEGRFCRPRTGSQVLDDEFALYPK